MLDLAIFFKRKCFNVQKNRANAKAFLTTVNLIGHVLLGNCCCIKKHDADQHGKRTRRDQWTSF